MTVACWTTTGRRYDTQERATKIYLVGPLGVSATQGLLPVGMATSHCSVGVAVDAVLVMVAEVTVSRPDALRFFGYRDYYSTRGEFALSNSVRSSSSVFLQFFAVRLLAIITLFRLGLLNPVAENLWWLRYIFGSKRFLLHLPETMWKIVKRLLAHSRHWRRKKRTARMRLNRRESIPLH